MTDIILSTQNGEPVASSRQIAENFGKEHRNVMRDIENLMSEGVLKNEQTPMFYKTEYTHEQNGQTYPMYLMNRDGFSLLVMGFTGKAALEWKLKYIAAFNAMEKKLALRRCPSSARSCRRCSCWTTAPRGRSSGSRRWKTTWLWTMTSSFPSRMP